MKPDFASDIGRIHAPSREEFDGYVERNQPVVLTGVASEWPAREWDVDYLRSVAGDVLVNVPFQEHSDFQQWYTPGGMTRKEMRLREYLDMLTAETPDRRYYMSEYDVSRISRDLLADIDASPYADGEPKLFLGRDTCMPLHYHATTEAILCQLRGTKEVLLYSPDQYSLLYPYPWYSPPFMFSRIDGRHQVGALTTDTSHLDLGTPEPDRFPKFERAKPMVVHLEPGEILLIPVHWWHLTSCAGLQINTTFFWRSKWRRYALPLPGLGIMAREMLWKTKKRFRRQRTPARCR